MAGYDTWFGFELNQRYTLEKKLAPLEEAAAIIAAFFTHPIYPSQFPLFRS